MYAAGIDLGTTTISGVVIDLEKRELKKAYTTESKSFIKTEYDWEKIQDPEIILAKAQKLLDQMFEEYKEIQVIGLTGQMHGILYLNKKGEHISPLYTWQDGRGEEKCFSGKSICEGLKEDFGIHACTGYGLVTHLYHVKKGLVPREAAGICTIMDYLGMRLTKRRTPRMHSSNGASLGLYDVETASFQEEVLKENGCNVEILPELTENVEEIGSYRGARVCVALGDNQASFLGAVEDSERSVLVNMGTGGQISVLTDTWRNLPGIEFRPFSQGKYLAVGSSLCGGRAYAVLKDFFAEYAEAMGIPRVDHYAVMDKLLEQDQKRKEPLLVSPTFSGTREEPWKRGSITNICVDNFTPGTLIYGVLDGMAEELFARYQAMEGSLSHHKDLLVASGNGLRRNKGLQRIMREKFSMKMILAKYEEEAAYGAAKAAALWLKNSSLNSQKGMKE